MLDHSKQSTYGYGWSKLQPWLIPALPWQERCGDLVELFAPATTYWLFMPLSLASTSIELPK